jgi:hypothetical protein
VHVELAHQHWCPRPLKPHVPVACRDKVPKTARKSSKEPAALHHAASCKAHARIVKKATCDRLTIVLEFGVPPSSAYPPPCESESLPPSILPPPLREREPTPLHPTPPPRLSSYPPKIQGKFTPPRYKARQIPPKKKVDSRVSYRHTFKPKHLSYARNL